MKVTGLFRYALKSARGASLREARLDAFGIEHDRRWAVLGEGGRVLTQRDCPKLATISARITAEGIVLASAAGEVLHVLRPSNRGHGERVEIWDDTTTGLEAGREPAEWLSRLLGMSARLVYMPDAVERPVDPRFGRPGDRVGFADGYPLLLASESSLADLNGRLDTPVPMDRFRANLIVDGAAPFAEDSWAAIRVADVIFRVVKPCARCVVITVDQDTGSPGKEPLRTLADFRKREGKVLFGQNLIHDGTGTLRLGDPVEVLETKPA